MLEARGGESVIANVEPHSKMKAIHIHQALDPQGSAWLVRRGPTGFRLADPGLTQRRKDAETQEKRKVHGISRAGGRNPAGIGGGEDREIRERGSDGFKGKTLVWAYGSWWNRDLGSYLEAEEELVEGVRVEVLRRGHGCVCGSERCALIGPVV
jgi:hypothetical protein